jgi:hypothetical protein
MVSYFQICDETASHDEEYKVEQATYLIVAKKTKTKTKTKKEEEEPNIPNLVGFVQGT